MAAQMEVTKERVLGLLSAPKLAHLWEWKTALTTVLQKVQSLGLHWAVLWVLL